MKIIKLSLLLATMLVQSTGVASQFTNTRNVPQTQCNLSTVRSVTVPLDSVQKNNGTFIYKYQIIERQNSVTPTIVYIPGGPGANSINEWETDALLPTYKNLGLPANANVLFTDPRDSGCNYHDDGSIPTSTLTSYNIASDILAAIRDSGIKNYIIYGHSYGSLVATIVASRARKGEAPAPLAVALTGTLGKGEAGPKLSTISGIKTEWQKLVSSYPYQLQHKLLELEKKDSDLATYFFTGAIYWGKILFDDQVRYPLKELFDLLMRTSVNDPKIADLLKLDDPRRPNGTNYSRSEIFPKISCDEFSDTDGSFEFADGKWNQTNFLCKKPGVSNPFDSKLWQVGVPIYYFAGTADPATPYEVSRYHFENQNQSKKFFITIPDGGHLRIGQAFSDCSEGLWSSIFNDGVDLQNALSKCKMKSRLEAVRVR